MPQRLHHHESTDALRRELCTAASGLFQLADEAGPAASDWMGMVLASAYANALSAILAVARTSHGEQVADALAAELELILADVDYGGDYNTDVWPAQPATPSVAGGAE